MHTTVPDLDASPFDAIDPLDIMVGDLVRIDDRGDDTIIGCVRRFDRATVVLTTSTGRLRFRRSQVIAVEDPAR